MEPSVAYSVVVPVYNSRESIDDLVGSIDGVFRAHSFSYELVLVNDHSIDGTWERIRELALQYPSIKGISFRKNFGQDNALMAGLRRARGKFIIIMDDDLQHNPEYIPKLIEEAEKGHDVVYAGYRRKRHSFWKNFGSWFNGKVAQLVLHKPRNVYLSPFKIIRAEVAREICAYEGPYPYIDGLLFRVTANFSQIDIEHRPRMKGKSTYTFWKSVVIWSHLATNFSVIPLRIASLLGMGTALTGMVMGVFFVIDSLHHKGNPTGWASLIVSILTFGGIQLISIGVVGEYIGRAYLNINHQPQYIIHETISSKP